ncbi:hypothetical protein TTHERM_00392880 (macronuclear) [Tetrahymena thermophila SB210]|uniref:Uncharacterized protein n=1 Tax=Tetrahymena thermophila (strain SB210) TaxID=312017 RepID=Q233G1_TETTS|nr:hypothetical protein TTHERM_00392880 [Tetrahymena thermophila SB210]EAR91619.2 hypothetical protein TTHERM_00392880 [Tetrahymena thermophila SB210]|eukprot:XP_001011864.2 hypothetical protein TTHERM_00392880 [Tetrahymena thermophila SB210]
MIQEKYEAKKTEYKSQRVRHGYTLNLNNIFDDLDLEQDSDFKSLLDYQLFDKVRKKIKTAQHQQNTEKENSIEMEQEPLPQKHNENNYNNMGMFEFYSCFQQNSNFCDILKTGKLSDQLKTSEFSPKDKQILSQLSVKQLQKNINLADTKTINSDQIMSPDSTQYYACRESEEDEDDEQEEKSTAPIDFDIENDQINSNSMLQESPTSYNSSYSQRSISSPIMSLTKQYQIGNDFVIIEQNKVKRRQKNHAMYKKYRCYMQQDSEQYNILQLESSQENIDLIHNYQQFNQSDCVLQHKYTIEEDNYIFLITEQFESFHLEYPINTNFQLIIASIKKICDFLLQILENKVIQLEIKAEHLCWTANGQIKLGFEVFKHMTKSQSYKSSKFMQIETSKKFCEQIIQTLKEVSEGLSYEIKSELNRFIEQQEQQEEKCTLQQFLKHPVFQIQNLQYYQIC